MRTSALIVEKQREMRMLYKNVPEALNNDLKYADYVWGIVQRQGVIIPLHFCHDHHMELSRDIKRVRQNISWN